VISSLGKLSHDFKPFYSMGLGDRLLFMGGMNRNEADEEKQVNSLYGIDGKGFVFGLENPIAVRLTGTVMHYLYLVNTIPNQEDSSKAQTIYDLLTDNTFRKHWNNTTPKGFEKLYAALNQFLERNKEADIGIAVRSIKGISEYSDNHQWAALLKTMSRAILATLTSTDAKVINITNEVLDNPKNGKAITSFTEEVNLSWRNRFMTENIREVLTSLPPEIKVYILVGAGHVAELKLMLEQMALRDKSKVPIK